MFGGIAMTVVAALIVWIGWQVWRLEPKAIERRLFLALAVIISGWMLTNYVSKATHDPGVFLLFVRLVMVITDLLPPALFLFSLCFPQGEINLSTRQKRWLLTWTVFITFLNLTNVVFTQANMVDGELSPQPGWGFIFVLINMLGLLSLACYNFFRKGKNARGLEKIRLTYFAFAFSLAMGFAVIFNLILPALFQNSDLMNVGIMAMGLTFVGATGYTMLKTTFSSIDLVIADGTYYLTLLIWLALPFMAHYWIPKSNQPVMVAVTFFLYLFWIGMFVYIYNHFEKYLIKKIVNHGADWSTEREKFFTRITDELSYEKIIDETLKFFALLIKNSGHLVIGDFLDDGELRMWGNLSPKAKKLFTMANALWQQRRPGPWIADTLTHSHGENLRQFAAEIDRFGVAAVFPICFYDEFKGVILFGNKLNGNPFFVQDIELINQTLGELSPLLNKAVIHQTTMDFNAHLQRKVNLATRRLRKMNEKLVIADKLKDEFVSVASHELRTPMTAIKGYLWMVAKNNTPEAIPTNQKYIEIALNSTERLISLVNDMLTISRIEGGRYALNLEKIDARDLVKQIHSELAPIAAEKNLKFSVKNPKEALTVKADGKRILEVLHNLTGNALKFTKEGSVTLTARSDPKFIYIDVADTGVGIDEEDFAKLFSKFARMEKSHVKIKETGTGLGLYISRQIMQMHHGDITFVSELSKGSTFTIYLPRAK